MDRTALVAVLVMLLAPVSSARAAESYDNCAGTITSLPTVISTQGVWCLKGDVTTSITTGTAITIAAHNVTLDCNGFKVGGLAAGIGTLARGIWVDHRLNAVVRNCNVRGFRRGIQVEGGGAYLLEDNRIDGSTLYGIQAVENSGIVRRNAVFDTGGAPLNNDAYAISVDDTAVVDDNLIDGLWASGDGGTLYGIHTTGQSPSISRNRIRGILHPTGGTAIGILAYRMAVVEGNHVQGGQSNAVSTGVGIDCENGGTLVARNFVLMFTNKIGAGCVEQDNMTW